MLFLCCYLLPLLVLFGLFLFFRQRALHREWLIAALEEQVRRELAHPVDYRGDQRERAIQQRLSRTMGKKAFSRGMSDRVQQAIDGHATLGVWHRE